MKCNERLNIILGVKQLILSQRNPTIYPIEADECNHYIISEVVSSLVERSKYKLE